MIRGMFGQPVVGHTRLWKGMVLLKIRMRRVVLERLKGHGAD
jgi:hypothetical protein